MALGREVILFKPPAKSQTTLAVSFAFPNTYEIGMSSLGYQLVWWLLEQDPDTSVSRVFMDCQESGWLNSQLIGFTLSWELDYINVLEILKKANVKGLSQQRDNDAPIIFGGGPVLTANPEPFAEIFDVILLGDAEVTVPAFLKALKETSHIQNRKQRLEALAATSGIYVPQFYAYEAAEAGPINTIHTTGNVPAEPTKQTYNAPEDYIAHSLMLAPDTTFGDTFLIEVVRSCPQECRFCLASYLTRPFRAASVENIVNTIEKALPHTKKIGLLGPSITEHPEFDKLASELMKREEIQISVPSVRADSLNSLIVQMIKTLHQKSVTIAIESGSERLRSIMKKNLTEEEILKAVELIHAGGLKNMKFYSIAGLPGERQEDLDETVRLMSQLKKTYKQMHFVLGVSSFVPKAQTPFQWSGRDKKSGEKIEFLRKSLSRIGIEVRPESHNWSDIQAVIARGDRRLTPVMLSVAENGGKLGAWRKAFRQFQGRLPDEEYYAFRNIPADEILPWSHLTQSGKATMLKRHNEQAVEIALKQNG